MLVSLDDPLWGWTMTLNKQTPIMSAVAAALLFIIGFIGFAWYIVTVGSTVSGGAGDLAIVLFIPITAAYVGLPTIVSIAIYKMSKDKNTRKSRFVRAHFTTFGICLSLFLLYDLLLVLPMMRNIYFLQTLFANMVPSIFLAAWGEVVAILISLTFVTSDPSLAQRRTQ